MRFYEICSPVVTNSKICSIGKSGLQASISLVVVVLSQFPYLLAWFTLWNIMKLYRLS